MLDVAIAAYIRDVDNGFYDSNDPDDVKLLGDNEAAFQARVIAGSEYSGQITPPSIHVNVLDAQITDPGEPILGGEEQQVYTGTVVIVVNTGDGQGSGALRAAWMHNLIGLPYRLQQINENFPGNRLIQLQPLSSDLPLDFVTANLSTKANLIFSFVTDGNPL